MKRFFIILVIACLCIFAWVVFQFAGIKLNIEPVKFSESPTPTEAPSDEHYAYSLISVPSGSHVSLIPNFSGKIGAKTLADENGCTQAVNGGFYDTSGNPLGLFFTDTIEYGTQSQSTLFNGYYWSDASGTYISTSRPENPYGFALQTGPLLVSDGQRMPLAIRNDEPARRIVVAKTTGNRDVFLAIYSRESVFGGPLLSDLPSVIESISRKNNLGITDALNLDGGSASAFYNGDTGLSELTPVGSVFCVK